MLAGVILGSLLVGGQATASPVQPWNSVSEERGQKLLKMGPGALSPTEFRELAEYLIAKQKKPSGNDLTGGVRSGVETVAIISQNGNQVGSTGVTVGWATPNVWIEGALYRPDNTQSYDDTRHCQYDRSCTFPTHYTDCTCQHGTWQLYVVGWQTGGGAVSDRADLVT